MSVLGGHFVTYLLFLIMPRITRRLSRIRAISVVRPVAEIVRELNELDPQVLHCYPTMLEVLAYEQKEGHLRIQPWIISSSSEPLTVLAREVIQRAFPRAQIFENYGTTEGVTIGAECAHHRGIHLNTDYYIIENVRDDGTEVGPDAPGDKVYLTCLFSRTMPLLRYELTDVTIALSEKCPCGLPFPMIRVRGRTDDIFWVYDEQGQPVVLPPIPFEAMLLEIEGIRQYQLVQEERNRLCVYFRPHEHLDGEKLKQEIQARLEVFLTEKALVNCVSTEVVQVSEIARDSKSGKIRQILSKVERLFLPGMPLGDRRSGEDRRARPHQVAEGERRQCPRRDDTPSGGEGA